MHRAVSTLAVLASVSLGVLACSKVPYTGRTQLTLIPKGQMHAMGATAYTDTLAATKVVKGGADVKTLREIGGRIADSANEPDFAWQFNLIDEAVVNAWCLPGGYIAFYTAILPVLQSEAGMAFVMGHEVGHATARHGAERTSQQLTMVGGLSVLDMFLSGSGKVSDEQRQVMMGAIGLGAEVGFMLPFSRKHEAEADVIGLMYMAEAGYPPAESVDVWTRMSALGGESPPEFLSTHPSNETRIAGLREWMPEAKKRYQRNKLGGDLRAVRWSGGGTAP